MNHITIEEKKEQQSLVSKGVDIFSRRAFSESLGSRKLRIIHHRRMADKKCGCSGKVTILLSWLILTNVQDAEPVKLYVLRSTIKS